MFHFVILVGAGLFFFFFFICSAICAVPAYTSHSVFPVQHGDMLKGILRLNQSYPAWVINVVCFCEKEIGVYVRMFGPVPLRARLKATSLE